MDASRPRSCALMLATTNVFPTDFKLFHALARKDIFVFKCTGRPGVCSKSEENFVRFPRKVAATDLIKRNL